MSFTRYQKPTSANIVYKDSHAVLAPEQLIVLSNKYKLLYNNNGTLEWMGFNGANLPLKLDGSALISSQYLPSYVDDVQEYNTFANFPSVGETGKIYVDISGSNKVYRWSGTSYFLITDLTNYYTKAEINTTTTTINSNASTEVTNRTNADTALSNRITPLETLKTNADASFTLSSTNVVLAKNIDMNTKTITNCPTLTTITTDLASEVTNRTNAVSTEVTNRTNADTALSGRITTLETFKTAGDINFSLADPTNFKILRPLDMTTNAIINCPTITTINSNASTEVTNRTNADTALSGRITTLETFKTAADLNFNLADATNFKIIRPLDMQTNAITNCPTITTINSNASTEVTNRTNADTALSGRITTLETFKTAADLNFNLADATNFKIIRPLDMQTNAITNCPTITTINSNASTEVTNRTNADNALSGRITSLETFKTYSDINFSLADATNFMIIRPLNMTSKGIINCPTLNTKTCDGSHRVTRPDIYSATASVTGSNFFEYASIASYKLYHVQWYVGTSPVTGWTLSTDATYTSINVSMTSGQTIRCIVLMCQD
jgi:hypothetical protein